MFKKVWLKSMKQTLRHKSFKVKEISDILGNKKDSSWQKFVSVETWANHECTDLLDYDYWIDIDAFKKGDLSTEAALRACTANCALLHDYLTKRLKVDSKAIQTYFSGHGGFHFLLPFKLPRDKIIAAAQIVAAAKHAALEIIEDLKPKWQPGSQVDLSIYGNSRQIRFPNSVHRTSGLRKVRIERGDLNLSPSKLVKRLQRKSGAFEGQFSMDWWEGKQSCSELEEWVLSKLPKPDSEQASHGANHSYDLPREFDGYPSCLLSILSLSSSLNWNKIQFNDAKMFIIGHLKSMNLDQATAIRIGQEFADKYSRSHRSASAKARERREEVVACARTFYKSGPGSNYDYNVPNRCLSIFASKFPTLQLHPCQNGKCEHADSSLASPIVGRSLSIKDLLKKDLDGNELWIYLIVALEGPFKQKNHIEKRTGLSKATVSGIVLSLQSKKLLMKDSSGIRAIRPVRNNARAKF